MTNLNNLKELIAFTKKYPGIDIHGSSIRISFYYHSVRCIEVLKGMIVSKTNIKHAANKRAVILNEIALSTFQYENHFPQSKKLELFGTKKKVPTVRTVYEQYLKGILKRKKYNTYLSYQDSFKTHILPKWADHKLDEITASNIKKWIDDELQKLKNKTINNTLIPFRGIYKSINDDEITDYNPFKHIKNLPVIKSEPDPFTQVEIRKIKETETDWIQEINAFSFNCWAGLRSSELIAIAWEDIDFDNWTLSVKRACIANRYSSTKTLSSERIVNLLEPAIKILKKQLCHSISLPAKTVEVLLSDQKTIRKESLRFIFLNTKTLKPLTTTQTLVRGYYRKHLQRAKVRYRPMKQTRHTYACQLITLGVNLSWIAQQMGHTTIKMLEKHYGKWMKEERPDMAKDISKLIKM